MEIRDMRRSGFCLSMALCVFLVGCAATSKKLDISFDPFGPSPTKKSVIQEQRKTLQEFLDSSPGDEAILSDVRLILDAMYFDAIGDIGAAIKSWREALPLGEGPMGEIAVKGWVKDYCKQINRKIDRVVLTKLVLAETQSGNLSPWMVSKGLLSEHALVPLLSEWVPEWITGDPASEGATLEPPTRLGIPAGDPVLAGMASEVCRYHRRVGKDWDVWRGILSSSVATYFDGLVEQCSGGQSRAIELLTQVGPLLSSTEATMSLAAEAYERVIKMRRDRGEREAVAPLYLSLMRIWGNPAVNEATLGMTRYAFMLRKIDTAMSAARSRALIGDTENAKLFAQETIRVSQMSIAESWAQPEEVKVQISNTMAEAYHLIGFRLAAEQHDWDQAISVATLALQIPSISDEWTIRLKWSLGLYDYLAGRFEAATRRWEQILSDQIEDSTRPMLLYWIAESHSKLGNLNESEFYLKTLIEDYPLSFYSVAGVQYISPKMLNKWQNVFGDIKSLETGISEWNHMDLEAIRSDARRSRLLRRAEVLVAQNISSFETLALDEVQKSIDMQALTERDVNLALYVSRLYGAAGNWLGSVSLTTKIMKASQFWDKHPEQLLVYFPKPWARLFHKAAVDSGVPESVLLAIARQESSFRTDAKSPAGAFGLMQLTIPTGKRLQSATGLNPGTLPNALYQPDLNIQLGAYYLKELMTRYQGQKSAVFAAYNAGEQTVDGWKIRRNFDNPFVFIELIPYVETRSYVKNVLRNEQVYQFLSGDK